MLQTGWVSCDEIDSIEYKSYGKEKLAGAVAGFRQGVGGLDKLFTGTILVPKKSRRRRRREILELSSAYCLYSMYRIIKQPAAGAENCEYSTCVAAPPFPLPTPLLAGAEQL